jgi:hypothetical protein
MQIEMESGLVGDLANNTNMLPLREPILVSMFGIDENKNKFAFDSRSLWSGGVVTGMSVPMKTSARFLGKSISYAIESVSKMSHVSKFSNTFAVAVTKVKCIYCCKILLQL